MEDFKPRSKVVLEEMTLGLDVPKVTENPVEKPLKNQKPRELRRSGRIIREPKRYMFNGEVFKAESIEHVDDPTTYKEAMEDVDSSLWQKAMNTEIESMDSNGVWKLVDLPQGIKPIRCK